MTGMTRFSWHFEPQKGWMNDPNGLIFFRGQYHAFFQHYPHAPSWGQMHWGHAVSDDLLHWKELPIALYPDRPYEDEGGCFSGSAVEKDGRLYLFYTSVSHGNRQTQSVAWSDDGLHFTKCPDNPVIPENPLGYPDFRDPKVSFIDGKYYMVVGTGNAESGKVLLFSGDDLLHWRYEGILFEGEEYAPCIECPDFFKLDGQYVLIFSRIGAPEGAVHFVVGDFVDGKLIRTSISRPEWGPDFYAPQTFWHNGRRIMIGWMYHWGKKPPDGCPYAGALSIPRELYLADGEVRNRPVSEAAPVLREQSDFVRTDGERLLLWDGVQTAEHHVGPIHRLEILEDTKSVEIFVNGGALSYTYWISR